MRRPHKTTVHLNGVTIGGVEISADIEVSVADMGIGPYEYWGFKGCHHDWGVDEILVKKASYEPGQDELPDMTAEQFLDQDKVQDELFEKATDAWQEAEAAACEPDDQDWREDR